MANWTELQQLLRNSPFPPLATKVRGQVLEVITPLRELGGRHLSVFVLQQQEQWIVTDGAWISRRLYGQPRSKPGQAVRKLLARYRNQLRILELEQEHRGVFYYLLANNPQRLPNKILQLAHYQHFALTLEHLVGQKAGSQADTPSFRQQADQYLQQRLHANQLTFGQDLADLEMVRFHVMAEHDGKLHLINYITGATPNAFINAITRAIVNFELAAKSRYADAIQEYYCIVNDEADGYLLPKLEIYLNYLNEKSSRPYLLWSMRKDGWPADTRAVMQGEAPPKQ